MDKYSGSILSITDTLGPKKMCKTKLSNKDLRNKDIPLIRTLSTVPPNVDTEVYKTTSEIRTPL